MSYKKKNIHSNFVDLNPMWAASKQKRVRSVPYYNAHDVVAPICDDRVESDIVESVATESDFRNRLSFSAKDCLDASMPKVWPK